EVFQLSASPDGRTLAASDTGQDALIWETASRRPRHQLTVPSLTTSSKRSAGVLTDALPAMPVTPPAEAPPPATTTGGPPVPAQLGLTRLRWQLDVRDTDNSTLFRRFTGNQDINFCADMSVAAGLVAAGAADGTVRVLDLRSGTTIATLATGSVVALTQF